MLLLDLPDALLVHCLAGAGGKGVCRAAAACRRLSRLTLALQQQPLFASAFSDDKRLEGAINDAAMRALEGTWGAVDFALLFVANYLRAKKYSDPSDAAHAATLLQGVLGKDIPIVGCCCSGVMGVDRDSRPVEVDPATSRAMPFSLVRRLGSGAPRRGVSLLLGRLPPGYVARTLAPANLPTDLPEPAAAVTDYWPEFSDALALTGSQAAQLAADLAAAGEGGSSGGSGSGSSGTAVLQPCTALLLYQSEYQGTEDLDATIAWLQTHAPAMEIVGGASSGMSGDLLVSPGAAHRLGTEAPLEPPLVGLLLCSAHTGDSSRPRAAAGAAAADAAGAAAAVAAAADSSAAGSSRGALAPAPSAACSSAGALRVASMSVQGVGPAPGSSVFVVDPSTVSVRPIAYAQQQPLVFILTIESATILAPGSNSASAAAEQPAVRRSERAGAGADAAAAAGASAAAPAVNGLMAMMEHLGAAGEFDSPMIAVWRCPPGATPAAFTGDEKSALVLSADPEDSLFDGSSLQLTLFELCRHPEGSTDAALQALVTNGVPGSLLCMQFVQFAGEASARAIARGFKTLQQQLQAPPPAAPAASAAVCRRLPGSAEDCYAALARAAAAAGARSSRQATAVFSCTGRGVSLFRPVEGAAAADAPCEAALVDAAWQQQAAFVGCYVDGELGPPVRNACLGFGGSQQPAQQQAYTSMYAVLSSS